MPFDYTYRYLQYIYIFIWIVQVYMYNKCDHGYCPEEHPSRYFLKINWPKSYAFKYCTLYHWNAIYRWCCGFRRLISQRTLKWRPLHCQVVSEWRTLVNGCRRPVLREWLHLHTWLMTVGQDSSCLVHNWHYLVVWYHSAPCAFLGRPAPMHL